MSISNLFTQHHKEWMNLKVNTITADKIQLIDTSGSQNSLFTIPIYDVLPAPENGSLVSKRESPTEHSMYYSDSTTWHKISNITNNVISTGSSTINHLVRWDDTTGSLIKDSGVLLDASDNMSGVADFSASGAVSLDDPIVDISAAGGIVAEAGLRVINPSGGAPNKTILFDTASGQVKAGTESAEQMLSYRETTPLDKRRMVWNDGLLQIDSAPDDSTTIWVSKIGNDANDGRTYETAKLTIGSAIGIASAGDVIVIESGSYTENINVPVDVSIQGLHVILDGQVTLSDLSVVQLRKIECSGGNALTFNHPTGRAGVLIDAITCTGNAEAIEVLNGTLFANIGAIETVNGDVVSETSSDCVMLRYGTILCTGSGNIVGAVGAAVMSLTGGVITANTGEIFKNNSGSPTMMITATEVTAANLSDITSGANASLRANKLTGTMIESGAGLVEISTPGLMKSPTISIEGLSGNVELKSSDTASSPTADLIIKSGSTTGADSGDVSINSGICSTSGTSGNINLQAGNSASAGGDINMNAGGRFSTGNGSDINLTAGQAGATSGVGGDVNVTGGVGQADTGGNILVKSGVGSGTGGASGYVNLETQNATGLSSAGDITLKTGNGSGSGSSDGGDIYLTAGSNGGSGSAGDIIANVPVSSNPPPTLGDHLCNKTYVDAEVIASSITYVAPTSWTVTPSGLVNLTGTPIIDKNTYTRVGNTVTFVFEIAALSTTAAATITQFDFLIPLTPYENRMNLGSVGSGTASGWASGPCTWTFATATARWISVGTGASTILIQGTYIV